MQHPVKADPEFGFNVADEAVVITGMGPTARVVEYTRGGFMYDRDVQIIHDLLKPYEENLDYNLRARRSSDNAFLKKAIIDRGRPPA